MNCLDLKTLFPTILFDSDIRQATYCPKNEDQTFSSLLSLKVDTVHQVQAKTVWLMLMKLYMVASIIKSIVRTCNITLYRQVYFCSPRTTSLFRELIEVNIKHPNRHPDDNIPSKPTKSVESDHHISVYIPLSIKKILQHISCLSLYESYITNDINDIRDSFNITVQLPDCIGTQLSQQNSMTTLYIQEIKMQ